MASSDEFQDPLEVVDDCLEYIAKTVELAKDNIQTTEKVLDDRKTKLEDSKISIAANARTVEALRRTLEAVKLSLENDFEAVDEVENTLNSLKLTAKSAQNGENNLEDKPNNMHVNEENNVPSLFSINFEKDRQETKDTTEGNEEFVYAEMNDTETQSAPDKRDGNIEKNLKDEKTESENCSREIKLESKKKLSENKEAEISEEFEMMKEEYVQCKEKQTSSEELEIAEDKSLRPEAERPLEDYELAEILVGLNEAPENIHFANEEFLRPENVLREIKKFENTEVKSEQSKETTALYEKFEIADEQSVRLKGNGSQEIDPDREEYEQNNEISRLAKEFELLMENYEQSKATSELNDKFELAKEQSVLSKDISGVTEDFNFTERKFKPPKEKRELTDEFKFAKEPSLHLNEKHSGKLELSKEVDTDCELVKEKPLVLIVQPKPKLDESNEFELTWEKYMQPNGNHPEEFEMADEQFVQLTYQTEVIKEAFKLAREKSAQFKETPRTAKKPKMEDEKFSQPKENPSKLDDGIFVRPKDKPRVSKKSEMAKEKSGGSKESRENKDQPVTTKTAFEMARDKSVRPKEAPERSKKKSVRAKDQTKETNAFELAKDAPVRPKEKGLIKEVDRTDHEHCSKESSETDENVDEEVTSDYKPVGMDNPMNAMLFSEQLIEYVLNKLGYSWPCDEGARNLPKKCVSTRFSSVIGETIIAIIDSNIDKIAESYKQLIQKKVHRIDSFRIEVCVTATFFFAAGYSHIHYLIYAAQLAGLSAFYFASGNTVIAEASAQVLAYIMNYYIYQFSFCPGSDWFNLHLHAQILKNQIQNGTIRFFKPQEPQCNL